MFDYVIVGAGSAGCVLAGRLSEDPGVSVLLLEAGGSEVPRESQVPAAFSKLFRGPCDWAYETEPQERLHGRRLFWPRGKLLGGSSAMNAMIYIRGNRLDYDHWRGLGNPGWGFVEVLPCFKRSERQERGASEYHGAEGPLHVSDLRCVNPLAQAFVAAGTELGLPHNPDFNGAVQDGVGLYQVTQRQGRRHSAADAFLRPAMRRRNLGVITGAHATRVLFEGRRAAGVEYLRGGRVERARAAREVVLCGGSINSPQLLLLSGVGPADALRALGIPVVANLPGVGENLQDHLAVPVIYDCTRPVSLDSAETAANLARYLLLGTGPFTSNVAEAGAFVRTRPDLPAPDLQILMGAAFFLDHGFTRRPGDSFTVGPTLLTPLSRGRISLRSADPRQPPSIEPEYLAHEEDLRTLVQGLEISRDLAHGDALAPFRGRELYPGDGLRTRHDLEEHVRARAQTLYHPVGTCRMGTDERAVVDAALRVRGVEGLRVADASVMPTIVRGNTNAPVIMIGEKAVDLLLGPRSGRSPEAVAELPPVAR